MPNGSFISQNHWVDTPIYIPAFSEEGFYNGHDGSSQYTPNTDMNDCIQFMVDALNVEEHQDIQKIKNNAYDFSIYDDGAAYKAIYNMKAEVSGWIYDFTIVGTSDSDQFGGMSEEQLDSTQAKLAQDYSFADNKEDKKSGVTNRIGDYALRYVKDGTIEGTTGTYPNGSIAGNWKLENTIALTGEYYYTGTDGSKYRVPGKSNAFDAMGGLPKGYEPQQFFNILRLFVEFIQDPAFV